jgi:hypothetical protein
MTRRRVVVIAVQVVIALMVVASYFAVLTHGFKVW